MYGSKLYHRDASSSRSTSNSQPKPRGKTHIGAFVGLVVATMLAIADPTLGHGTAYVVGDLSGPLARGLEDAVSAVPLPAADGNAAAAPVLLAGSTVEQLSDTTKEALAAAFRKGWPIAVIDLTDDQVNALHTAVDSGQAFTTLPDTQPAETFAFVQAVEAGYSQRISKIAGASSASAENRASRAADLLDWMHAALDDRRVQPVTRDAGPPELTDLVNSWAHTSQLNVDAAAFLCTVEVWQAHQVSTEDDFYYMNQNCNFNPTGTFETRGKTIPDPLIHSTHWDDVSWSNTSDYCVPSDDAGDAYTACDYYNYATKYSINLQPYAADQSAGVNTSAAVLVQENPQTTTENSSVTHGVQWSIGGQVVAGRPSKSVSLNAGVQVSNETTTTIPAYTIDNNSVGSADDNNGAWAYNIPAVTYIDDICTNTMNAPADIQTANFEPTQDLVWQVDSGYRSESGFDGYFNVMMNFTAYLSESSMYVDVSGIDGDTNPSNCNLEGCSCSIIAKTVSHSLGATILQIPAPATDYVDPTSAAVDGPDAEAVAAR